MIDFHCHLDLYPNPQAVRDECVRRGLDVLSVTTTPSAWRGTAALGAQAPRIRTGLGLHPQLAHERKNELALFDGLLSETDYVGEIGLDGAPEFRKHWTTQLAAFEHILLRCKEAGGKILSVHSRRAASEVLTCLDAFSAAGTPVLHWFSGTLRELDRAIELGCWFSVGPTMLSSKSGRAIASRLPKDRVLTESDGPFAQLSGESVKPWQVDRAIQELGQIWSLGAQEVERNLNTNLESLLGQSWSKAALP